MEHRGPVLSVPVIPKQMLCNSSGKASKMQQQLRTWDERKGNA